MCDSNGIMDHKHEVMMQDRDAYVETIQNLPKKIDH